VSLNARPSFLSQAEVVASGEQSTGGRLALLTGKQTSKSVANRQKAAYNNQYIPRYTNQETVD
jgi:hypothetical protein